MNQFYPGHVKRMRRRYRAATILMIVGLVPMFALDLWPRNSPTFDGLPWVLNILGLGCTALTIVGLVLALSALRELTRLPPPNRQDN
jgi:hypothetical protein